MQGNYVGASSDRHRGLGFLIGAILLIAVVAVVLTMAFRPYYYAGMAPYYGGWFFFPFGFFFIIFILFGVSRLLFWPWGWGWRRGYWRHYSEAREILRTRYARGEITREQFDQMMSDLEKHE